MKVILHLKTSELDESVFEAIRLLFKDSKMLSITVSSDRQDEPNVDDVLALAGTVDDADAKEITQIINDEFSKTDTKRTE